MKRECLLTRLVVAGAALVLLLGAVETAKASNPPGNGPYSFYFNGADGNWDPLMDVQGIDDTSPTSNVYVGPYLATTNGVEQYVYCIDTQHNIGAGETGQAYIADLTSNLPYSSPLASYFQVTSNKVGAANAISYLVNQGLSVINTPSISTTTKLAGVDAIDWTTANQLAIWQIMAYGHAHITDTFPTQGFGVTVTSVGNLSASQLLTLANQQIDNAYGAAANWTGTSNWIITSPYDPPSTSGEYQNFAYGGTGVPPIPEPLYCQMSVLAGLIGLGWYRRRAK